MNLPTPHNNYIEFGAYPSAVPWARSNTRHLLSEWSLGHMADDVELVVSELVTNAIKATQTGGRAAYVSLRLHVAEDQLVVEVWDSYSYAPVIEQVSRDAESGRGLSIVDMMCKSWGYFPVHKGGKVVWATFQLLTGVQAQVAEFRSMRSILTEII